MVAVRSITLDLWHPFIDLLKASDWVVIPAVAGGATMPSSPESLQGVPKDFPRIVVSHSAEELGRCLPRVFAGERCETKQRAATGT